VFQSLDRHLDPTYGEKDMTFTCYTYNTVVTVKKALALVDLGQSAVTLLRLALGTEPNVTHHDAVGLRRK
jgi:hypothetical protein